MKIIKLHDPESRVRILTSKLEGSSTKHAKFLPSLTFLHNESKFVSIYLLTYRVWKRAKGAKNVTLPGVIGHPWYNHWGYSQYDGTGFATLRIDTKTNSVDVIKENIPQQSNWRVDMRILQKNDNVFYVTYNTFGRLNPNKRHLDYTMMRPKHSCFHFKNPISRKIEYDPSDMTLVKFGIDPIDTRRGCTFQNVSTMTMSRNLIPTFDDTKLVCAETHKHIEKNISMILKNGKLMYQYSIIPWLFLDDKCKIVTPRKVTLFQKIAEFYDNTDSSFYDKHVQFSCSSPLISYNNKEYIATGHFKIKFNGIDALDKTSNAYKFTKTLKHAMNLTDFNHKKYSNKIHYELIYGMFVYTVNKTTLKLSRSSNCFVIFDGKKTNALTYPSGIIHNKQSDEYMISYHENDISMKVLVLSQRETEHMLIHTNSTSPQNMDFKILRVKN